MDIHLNFSVEAIGLIVLGIVVLLIFKTIKRDHEKA